MGHPLGRDQEQSRIAAMNDPVEGVALPLDVTHHPLVRSALGTVDTLSPVEKICQKIAQATGSPTALALAIAVQAIWIPIGVMTHLDPFPFAFLLTCSNIIQLILIFVLAVGQRQAATHAELRAEHDHQSISRLLYHQELQEQVLIALARKMQIEVENIEAMVEKLAEEGD
jgi:uncharacterized membrane protein